jgi:hypothetical protein
MDEMTALLMFWAMAFGLLGYTIGLVVEQHNNEGNKMEKS